LNCDGVTVIAPGAAIRYAMELAIPSGATPGVAKFSWAIEGSDGPFVGSSLTVR
jgi:hypothetical protein